MLIAYLPTELDVCFSGNLWYIQRSNNCILWEFLRSRRSLGWNAYFRRTGIRNDFV